MGGKHGALKFLKLSFEHQAVRIEVKAMPAVSTASSVADGRHGALKLDFELGTRGFESQALRPSKTNDCDSVRIAGSPISGGFPKLAVPF